MPAATPLSPADIADLSDTLDVAGHEVTVYPLSIDAIGALMARHSALLGMLNGSEDLVETISDAGPAAVGDVIASATRGIVPSETAQILGGGDQGNILATSLDMTLPREEVSLANFLSRLGALMARAQKMAPAKSGSSSSNS